MADLVRYTDDDLRVILQDWSLADPDQATAINMAAELLALRERVRFQDIGLTAIANDMRSAGCSFDEKRTPIIRNDRAEAAEAKLALAEQLLREVLNTIESTPEGIALDSRIVAYLADAAIAAGEGKGG